MNVNVDLVGYEYKTDSSNSDLNPDRFESGYLLDLKHRAITSISLFCQQFYSRSESLYK